MQRLIDPHRGANPDYGSEVAPSQLLRTDDVLVFPPPPILSRKPLRKDENGASVAEYPMSSSPSNKGVDVNAAVV